MVDAERDNESDVEFESDGLALGLSLVVKTAEAVGRSFGVMEMVNVDDTVIDTVRDVDRSLVPENVALVRVGSGDGVIVLVGFGAVVNCIV